MYLAPVKGLEYSLSCAENLQVEDVSLLFNHYLNLCPGQGSRTIRTEVGVVVGVVTCLSCGNTEKDVKRRGRV